MRYLENKDSITDKIKEIISAKTRMTPATVLFDAYATDGENRLWMCQNHHKLFDSNILLLPKTGAVSYKNDLTEDDHEYIDSVTTVTALPANLVTPGYINYIGKRYSGAAAAH